MHEAERIRNHQDATSRFLRAVAAFSAIPFRRVEAAALRYAADRLSTYKKFYGAVVELRGMAGDLERAHEESARERKNA